MQIMFEGKEIPFREYLILLDGSGQLYDDHIRNILKDWRSTSWADVDDYVCHIAAQVISRASDDDRESYNKIMELVEKVYEKQRFEELKQCEEGEYILRRESIRIVKKEKSPIPDQEN